MSFFTGVWTWLGEAPDRIHSRSANFLLATICSAFFLDLTNLSAITIALPEIRRDLSVNLGDLQWVLSGYALTFGAFLLVGGRAGDIYSHRTVMLVGMSIFAIFTLACALASNFVALIVARALQGIGAALTVPSAQAHIPLFFTAPKARAKALGIWGATASLGFLMGLVIGGVVTNNLGWRWIFWISLMCSGTLLPIAILTLPFPKPESSGCEEVSEKGERKRFLVKLKDHLITFDAVGVLLIVPALLLLTYALSSGNAKGWSSPSILSTLIVAAVLIPIFAVHETRVEHRLLPTQLFRNLSFNLVLVVATNISAIRQGVTYFLTIQLQSFGNSPMQTSVLYLPMGIGALIFNVSFARLLPVLGARMMLTVGWISMIIAVIFFSFTDPTRSFWTSTFIGELFAPIGMATITIASNFVIMSLAPKGQQGAAAGILNVAIQVGGAVIGLSALTAVVDAVGESSHQPARTGAPPEIAFRAVYYSSAILAFIGLVISAIFLHIPEALRGRKFISVKKRARSVDSGTTAVEPELRGEEDAMPLVSAASPPAQVDTPVLNSKWLAEHGSNDIGVQTGESLADSEMASVISYRAKLGLSTLTATSDPSTTPTAPPRAHMAVHGRSSTKYTSPSGEVTIPIHRSHSPQPFADQNTASQYVRAAGPSVRLGDSKPGRNRRQPPSRFYSSRRPISLGPYSWYNETTPTSATLPTTFEDRTLQSFGQQPRNDIESGPRQPHAASGAPRVLRFAERAGDVVEEELSTPTAEERPPHRRSKRQSWRNSWLRLPTLRLDSEFSLEELGEALGLERLTY